MWRKSSGFINICENRTIMGRVGEKIIFLVNTTSKEFSLQMVKRKISKVTLASSEL